MGPPDAAARLEELSAQIVVRVERVIPGWVMRQVLAVADAWGGLDAPARARLEARAAAAGEVAAARVTASLRALFAAPAHRQQATPLEVVRTATREISAVLADAGVPARGRDAFHRRAFPEDVYGVTPGSLADLGDDALAVLQLAWGVAKAEALRGAGPRE